MVIHCPASPFFLCFSCEGLLWVESNLYWSSRNHPRLGLVRACCRGVGSANQLIFIIVTSKFAIKCSLSCPRSTLLGSCRIWRDRSSYRNSLCPYRFHKYLASCSSTWEQTEPVELRIGTVLGLMMSLGAERTQSVSICHANMRTWV